MNSPYVKQFVEERELTLILLVDLSRSGWFGSGHRSKRDLAIEIASILAFSAIQNNDRVGLILFTDRIESYVPPRKGSSHGLRLIRDLLFYEPAGSGTRIRVALDFLNLVSRRRAVVFLISDFQSADLEMALPVTSKRHDLVPVRIIDPLEERWPRLGLVELEDLETGERLVWDSGSRKSAEAFVADSKTQADRLKRLFASLKLDTLTFRTDQSVVEPLRKFFLMRRRRQAR